MRMTVQERFSVRESEVRGLALKLNIGEQDNGEGEHGKRSRLNGVPRGFTRPAGYHTERRLRRTSRGYLAGSNNLAFAGICVSISRTIGK
jgi:hypothetical protein